MADDIESTDQPSRVEKIDGRQIEQARMRVAWDDSIEKWDFWRSVKLWAIYTALGVTIYVVAVIFYIYPYTSSALSSLYVIGIVLFLVVVYGHAIRYAFKRRTFRSRTLLEAAQERVADAEEKAAEDDELGLAGLWVAAQSRLGYYHDIALGQAKASFLSGQVATGLGFLLLAGAVLTTLFTGSTSAGIVAGVVGIAGAALAGYIGRTFIRAQEAATRQLQSYFSQPLEVSRYLAAERLAQNLEGNQRDEAVRQIISVIMKNDLPADLSSSEGERPTRKVE